MDSNNNSDRYEFQEKIGEGGLGTVYKGFDSQLKRTIALKRVISLGKEIDENSEEAQTLVNEATALSSFQHPNILTVYDIAKDEQGYFVVMEYLKGDTIDDAIKRGALTQKDFSGLVVQSLEGLIAAHAKGLVHRDIKPSNIMFTWTPSGRFQVKILDFGLAKFSRTPSVQTMDQENAIMGSIYFMAPEQFERKPLDQRIDIYSMGCIYYYSLTGKYPFFGDNAAQVMSAHLQHQVTHLKEIRNDLPLYLCNWVMRLISRKPEYRPQSAKECLLLFLNKSSGNPELDQAKPPAKPTQQARQNSKQLPRKLITGKQPTQTSKPVKLITSSQKPASKLITQSQLTPKLNVGKNPTTNPPKLPSPTTTNTINKNIPSPTTTHHNKAPKNQTTKPLMSAEDKKKLTTIILISTGLFLALATLVFFFVL